jgi:nuclear transport factor 2 (NTF2) superfamily protein
MTEKCLVSTPAPIITPPFTFETATAKVRAAEDAWNSRDPERVALSYSNGATAASSSEAERKSKNCSRGSGTVKTNIDS